MVRTRFAPSPTGYLHLGGARTALFCWAYARKHGGTFLLRIEDTDQERSTQAATEAILDGMQWLGLDYEGPYHQMDRLERYREVADQLLQQGGAYYDYATREELDTLREQQRSRGEKPRYDGRWRPENAKRLGLVIPAGVAPVLRFRNPDHGNVHFDDLVKGPITIANGELDDLVLMRSDGVPTYNFGVVVDDIDMRITHVIRGDDHVNNTPRQINIYRALGAELPQFAHVPMILGSDGERLSKRHGAVSVMQYAQEGFLPEAVVNYLARLGWSHGDDEKFSREQLVEWFDLGHISKSAARFNPDKLLWLNAQYMKEASDTRLAELIRPYLASSSPDFRTGPPPDKVVALLKERCDTIVALARSAAYFYRDIEPPNELTRQYMTPEVEPLLIALRERLRVIEWTRSSINQAIKEIAEQRGLRLPKIAMPVRVAVTGTTQTPAIDATLELIGRERVIARIDHALGQMVKARDGGD